MAGSNAAESLGAKVPGPSEGTMNIAYPVPPVPATVVCATVFSLY
jgi:hypothetical protein